MSESKRKYYLPYEVREYFDAVAGRIKYMICQFEHGHVTGPYDAVILFDGLLLRLKDLAENDFIDERIEQVKNVYYQVGKFSDNIVWNYEVHRYYHPDEIVDFIEVIYDSLKKIYEIE